MFLRIIHQGLPGPSTTAAIPSPHSLAAILSPSPSAPPDTPSIQKSTHTSPNAALPSSTPGDSPRAPTRKRSHEEAFTVEGPAEQRGYLQPGSPAQTAGRGQHRGSISSTVGTGADDGAVVGMIGGSEDRDKEDRKPAQQKMVRSSIACARCRRSKVKCKMDSGSAILRRGVFRDRC